MSVSGWHTILVLGAPQSGHAEYAAALLPGTTPRRLAAPVGAGPAELAGLLSEAKPDETLLVPDLGAWLAGGAPSEGLAQAVRACAARAVLVSQDAAAASGPVANLADRLGAVNRAVADAADAAILVVAGQPIWLKAGGAPARPAVRPDAAAGAAAARAAGGPAVSPTRPAPGAGAGLSNLAELPTLVDAARSAAVERLGALQQASLGVLERVVTFAAATQGVPVPAPWPTVRVLMMTGAHRGGAGAGAPAEPAPGAPGPELIAQLADAAGAGVRLVDAGDAAPMEDGPVLAEEAVEAALERGWELAQQAADEGVDLILLASAGAGADTAATAVIAAATGEDVAELLGRVRSATGLFDDLAWMRRCAAVRDAVYRARSTSRNSGRQLLAEVAGPDVATAAGVILGAAARRTPVLLDGPLGMAAALAGRDLTGRARHWCLLVDDGGHPAVQKAATVLGLPPLLDLRLELGEGATALATLPLLRSALTLAGTLPSGSPTDEPAQPPEPADAAQSAEPADAVEPVAAAGTPPPPATPEPAP